MPRPTLPYFDQNLWHTILNAAITAVSDAADAAASAAANAAAAANAKVGSVNGKTGTAITLTKADVGLGNVANTAPADLPVSTATAAELTAVNDAIAASEATAAQTYAKKVDLSALTSSEQAADLSIPSAALVASSLKTISLPAGSTWDVTIVMHVSGDPAADINVALTGPSGATITGETRGLAVGAGAVTGGHRTSPTAAFGTQDGPYGTIGVGVRSTITINARIKVSTTAGVVGVSLAQSTANATACILHGGSFLSGVRVA